MTSQPVSPPPSLWAHFRFSIVGSLLSAPVPHGGLRQALQDLADKTWTHPVYVFTASAQNVPARWHRR